VCRVAHINQPRRPRFASRLTPDTPTASHERNTYSYHDQHGDHDQHYQADDNRAARRRHSVAGELKETSVGLARLWAEHTTGFSRLVKGVPLDWTSFRDSPTARSLDSPAARSSPHLYNASFAPPSDRL